MDSRRLWKDLSVILSHSRSSHSLSFSSDEFLPHLLWKVSDVRGNTEDTALPTDSTTEHHLEQFDLVTESELRYIFTSISSKSCTLDPIPTFLHDLISERLPFVVRLCNTSFMEGVLPASPKCVHVWPSLKKPCMDHENINKYRPISNLSLHRGCYLLWRLSDLTPYAEAAIAASVGAIPQRRFYHD